MTKTIMGIRLSHRRDTASTLQDILTRYGCIINTRLGVHEASDTTCSEQGYIVLEFRNGSDAEVAAMQKELSALEGLVVRTMEL